MADPMTARGATGTGLGRAVVAGRPTVIMRRTDGPEAWVATVDGDTFADLPQLLEAADGDASRIARGDALTVTDAGLLPPVARPRKIVCVGQNYADHVSETKQAAAPSYPDLFAKWDNTLSAPCAEIPLPGESDQIDFESELTVVVGRRCRRVPAQDAASVVFGYTAANDGSVRDFQQHTRQRTAGKAWDALTPLGPVVVPAGHLGGTRPDLEITGILNGEVVQHSRTSAMLFDVPALLAYITTFMTLEPGDLILTGTPSGVGIMRNPPRFLTDGDEFEIRIEGIGAIRSRYRKEETR